MSSKRKFLAAANIIGTRYVTAETIEEAQKKALKMKSKHFKIRAVPAGLMVFDPDNPPKEFTQDETQANTGIDAGEAGGAVLQEAPNPDVQVHVPGEPRSAGPDTDAGRSGAVSGAEAVGKSPDDTPAS